MVCLVLGGVREAFLKRKGRSRRKPAKCSSQLLFLQMPSGGRTRQLAAMRVAAFPFSHILYSLFHIPVLALHLKAHMLGYGTPMAIMKIIAEVKKQGNESPAALIRRFTKRVQSTQALMRVREERYFQRKLSKLKTKRRALVSLDKRKTYERLKKLGKIPEKVDGHGRR